MRDFRKLQQDPPAGVNGSPTSDNILRWNAVIFGPEDTPWDGGKKEERGERGEICARLSLSRHRRPRPHTRPVTHTLSTLLGTFKLTLDFTEEYPNRPPAVKFACPMFHPNIYADGGICLDILQNQWSPIYDVAGVLTSIQVRGR